MTPSFALRSACRAATRAAETFPSDASSSTCFPEPDVQVWVVSEIGQGYDRLFTIRARKGSRMFTRKHWSAADVAGFEFERAWKAGLR